MKYWNDVWKNCNCKENVNGMCVCARGIVKGMNEYTQNWNRHKIPLFYSMWLCVCVSFGAFVCRFYMNYNDEFYRKSNKLKQTMLILSMRGNGLLHTWYLAFNSTRTRTFISIDLEIIQYVHTHMHSFIFFSNRANCSEQMSAHIQLRNHRSVQSVRDYVWQTQ